MRAPRPVRIAIASSLTLLLLATLTPAAVQAVDPPETWTFMMYAAADGVADISASFLVDAHPTANVEVLLLKDTYGDSAYLYRGDAGVGDVLLEAWGELDMGDEVPLRDFITYAKTNYPADRYLLAVYSHGGGSLGVCYDKTARDGSGGDVDAGWMYPYELEQGIADAGGVDIVAFTAPCLMGSYEIAYQLQDCVDVLIGSQELSFYLLWVSTMGPICDLLDDSSALSDEDVAVEIVRLFGENDYPLIDPVDAARNTMSAVSCAATAPVAPLLDLFADRARGRLPQLWSALDAALAAVWRAGPTPEYQPQAEIDLRGFVQEFAAATFDPVARDLALEIDTLMEAAVLAEHHGADQVGTFGSSIYFPVAEMGVIEYYGDGFQRFCADTRWNEFITEYLAFDPLTDIIGPKAGRGLTIARGPNPSAGAVTASFSLAGAGPVRLEVYDLAGRRVRTLCAEVLGAGPHSVVWDGRDRGGRRAPSGVYLFALDAGGRRASGKTALVN